MLNSSAVKASQPALLAESFRSVAQIFRSVGESNGSGRGAAKRRRPPFSPPVRLTSPAQNGSPISCASRSFGRSPIESGTNAVATTLMWDSSMMLGAHTLWRSRTQPVLESSKDMTSVKVNPSADRRHNLAKNPHCARRQVRRSRSSVGWWVRSLAPKGYTPLWRWRGTHDDDRLREAGAKDGTPSA
jgi:hypothetical protein